MGRVRIEQTMPKRMVYSHPEPPGSSDPREDGLAFPSSTDLRTPVFVRCRGYGHLRASLAPHQVLTVLTGKPGIEPDLEVLETSVETIRFPLVGATSENPRASTRWDARRDYSRPATDTGATLVGGVFCVSSRRPW